MDIRSLNLLNPDSPDFAKAQVVLWCLYSVVFRVLWLGYNAPPISWFVVYGLSGFIVTSLLAKLYWRLQQRPFVNQIVIAFLVATIVAMTWRVGFNVINFHIYGRDPIDEMMWYRYFYRSSSSALQLYGWSALYMLVAYYHKFIGERERAMAAELKLKEAEVKRLRHQLSPHMVFNLLTSMDTVLLKNNVNEARTLLADLSLYLRDTLAQGDKTSCTFKQELAHVERYLAMEKRRFKDRLKITYKIDPAIEELEVPSLLLQPVIENSIKHGVERYITGIEINISGEKQGDSVIIRVTDRKLAASKDETEELRDSNPAAGFGIGLTNTRQRLELMYGNRASLQADFVDEMTYEVQISIRGVTE